MANEIVKYHHELNTIPLRKFTPVEMNLFFSIVSRMREKGDKTVRFTFDQLKDLSNYKATANVRFVDDLKTTYEKILSLRFGRRSESGLSYEMFVIQNQWRYSWTLRRYSNFWRCFAFAKWFRFLGTLFSPTIQRAAKQLL